MKLLGGSTDWQEVHATFWLGNSLIDRNLFLWLSSCLLFMQETEQFDDEEEIAMRSASEADFFYVRDGQERENCLFWIKIIALGLATLPAPVLLSCISMFVLFLFLVILSERATQHLAHLLDRVYCLIYGNCPRCGRPRTQSSVAKRRNGKRGSRK